MDVLDLLAELGVGICNIDQPLFHRSAKPTAHVRAPRVVIMRDEKALRASSRPAAIFLGLRLND